MNSDLFEKITSILNDTQITKSNHEKNRIKLSNLYKNTTNKTEFMDCLYHIFKHFIVSHPTNVHPKTEKAIDFIILFCTGDNLVDNLEENGLVEGVINFLLKHHNLDSPTIRFRVCEFLSRILSRLDGTDLTEDLCSHIEENMFQRLEIEGKADVRFYAVTALHQLQNADNEKCRIIPILITHMNGDINGKVRKICVEKIAIRRDSIVGIISRTRDVNAAIRLAAFKRISKIVKSLKISERHTVIINGINDESKDVKDYIEKYFIQAWFIEYDNDYLKFIEAMRLDTTEEHIKNSLDKPFKTTRCCYSSATQNEDVFNVLTFDSFHLIKYEDLHWNTVIYWKYLVKVIQKCEKYETEVDNILPELVHFAAYVKNYYNSTYFDRKSYKCHFVLKQLFKIAKNLDSSDELNRKRLSDLIIDAFYKVYLSNDVAEAIIKCVQIVIPNTEQQSIFISEIINNILHTDTKTAAEIETVTTEINDMQLKLTKLQNEQNQAIKETDYDAAASYKIQIHEVNIKIKQLQEQIQDSTESCKSTNPSDLIKLLVIARAFLRSKRINHLNQTLKTLCDTLILEYILHNNEVIQTLAMECYAMCCIMNESYAEKGIFIFATYILANAEEHLNQSLFIISIKAVADIIRLIGTSILDSGIEQFSHVSCVSIIQTLIELMDEEVIEIQECATLALCNLIISGQIKSSTLIARMILKWCNPLLEEMEGQKVRQLIGSMLELLPAIPGSASQLEKCIIPTICALIKAPKSHPLSEVNVMDVLKFVLTLCSTCVEETDLHGRIALVFYSEMITSKNPLFDSVLSKALLLLDLSESDGSSIFELGEIYKELNKTITNKLTKNSITKFIKYLDSISSKTSMLATTITEDSISSKTSLLATTIVEEGE